MHAKKYKEKTLQSIIIIKSKETRVVTYACSYSNGHLISKIQLCQDELGIKCLLEYLQTYVTTLNSLLFCKFNFDPYLYM